MACVKDTTTVGKHVDSWQLTFVNRSHVKYEFTNTKKFAKKLSRIETSSICRQQFADCLSCEGRFRFPYSDRYFMPCYCNVVLAFESVGEIL